MTQKRKNVSKMDYLQRFSLENMNIVFENESNDLILLLTLPGRDVLALVSATFRVRLLLAPITHQVEHVGVEYGESGIRVMQMEKNTVEIERIDWRRDADQNGLFHLK
jgi:hypothetical protein